MLAFHMLNCVREGCEEKGCFGEVSFLKRNLVAPHISESMNSGLSVSCARGFFILSVFGQYV